MSRRSGEERSERRILWLGLILSTWVVVIIWRLAWIQVVQHDDYRQRAKRNQERKYALIPPRGEILDRDGNILATTLIYGSVYADLALFNSLSDRDLTPSERKLKKEMGGMTPDLERQILGGRRQVAVQALAPLLEYDPSELMKILDGDRSFLWLKRRLDPEKAELVRKAIEDKRLNGIRIREEVERNYPNRQLASQLLGYVGSVNTVKSNDGDPYVGKTGIEKQFDTLLNGSKGEVSLKTDNRGRPWDRQDLPATPGHTIHLTIDSALQRKAERLLDQAVRLNGAKGGGLIVMNPSNGEILALANSPGFDPNDIGADVASNPAYVNRAVSTHFEPGSIFKIVTYAAALEEGIVRPEDIVDCGNGQMSIGSRIIRDTHSYGRLTVEDAFAKSSNVGAIRIAQRMGREKFYSYIKLFGFGDLTNIEQPYESRGLLRDAAGWRPDSIGSIAIGQEIAVTLIQAVTAIATIANKGFRPQPHLVKRVETATGVDLEFHPPQSSRETTRVISERTAQEMTRLLTRVVTDGTGRVIKLDGYSAAGKTGTPQKADDGRGYRKGKYMPSFLGFVPASSPRFAIVVMIDEPSNGSYYGGTVAAPVFARMAEAALGDNDILPDDPRYRESVERLAEKVKRSGGGEAGLGVSDGDETSDQTRLLDGNVGAGVAAGREADSTRLVAGSMPDLSGRVAKGVMSLISERFQSPAAPTAPTAPIVSRVSIAPARPTPTPNGLARPAGSAGEKSVARPVVSTSGDPSEMVMPDLRGRGKRSVSQTCEEMRLEPNLKGSGFAVSQSPPPGARVHPGDQCRVIFQ